MSLAGAARVRVIAFAGHERRVERHGARLVGRWETHDDRVVAIWEYDDREAYERINSAVVADPASAVAQKYRATIGPLFTEREEAFMNRVSTAKGG